jgi:dTDP-4-amino-4,6-dideoxygalactose transaminase
VPTGDGAEQAYRELAVASHRPPQMAYRHGHEAGHAVEGGGAQHSAVQARCRPRDLKEPMPTLQATAIPFHVPALPDVEGFLADARAIVESGVLSQGPFVRRLEFAMRDLTGSAEVVAVSNCSDGLIAALSVLAPAGGEVILPGFTYLATWQAAVLAGMVPVVADVDERGLLDPEAVSTALTARTGAILAVHLTGAPAPMAELREIADRAGVPLLADAAHAIGARLRDRPVGAAGDAEVFSIGATKQLAAGEGGFVALRDGNGAAEVRRFALQGHLPGAMDVVGPGMNLRLPELSAALALRGLDGFGAQLNRRDEIHQWYERAFAGLPLRLSRAAPGDRSSHKDQLVWVDEPADRAPLRAHLARRGIETKPYYDVAVPDLTAFVGRVSSADRSRQLAARSFALPIHARLSDGEVELIVEAVAEHFGR